MAMITATSENELEGNIINKTYVPYLDSREMFEAPAMKKDSHMWQIIITKNT